MFLHGYTWDTELFTATIADTDPPWDPYQPGVVLECYTTVFSGFRITFKDSGGKIIKICSRGANKYTMDLHRSYFRRDTVHAVESDNWYIEERGNYVGIVYYTGDMPIAYGAFFGGSYYAPTLGSIYEGRSNDYSDSYYSYLRSLIQKHFLPVFKKSLDMLEIQQEPNKRVYKKDENIDYTGVKVIAVYRED